VLDTFIKPQTDELAVKVGIKSQIFKYSKMRAETLDVVRERVLRIVKGKKLVGYHLPQKMADFGLFDGEVVLGDRTNTIQEELDISEAVPNALSPKKAPVTSEKQKAFQRLEIGEAYDMAKIFNGPDQP